MAKRGGMAREALSLLSGVREVAALANPGEPEAVRQRAFDAARERSSAHTDLPAARRITERLGWQWRKVLAVAHESVRQQSHALGAKSRGPASRDWLTEEHVAAVLTIVAGRLSADTQRVPEFIRLPAHREQPYHLLPVGTFWRPPGPGTSSDADEAVRGGIHTDADLGGTVNELQERT